MSSMSCLAEDHEYSILHMSGSMSHTSSYLITSILVLTMKEIHSCKVFYKLIN